MQDTKGDEFTGRMLRAINSMLVEMHARTTNSAESVKRKVLRRLKLLVSTWADQSMRICTSGCVSF